MKVFTWVLVVLAIIALLLAIWSPWLWQSLLTGLLLLFVAAAVHGNSQLREQLPGQVGIVRIEKYHLAVNIAWIVNSMVGLLVALLAHPTQEIDHA